jgi:hypothetical protein
VKILLLAVFGSLLATAADHELSGRVLDAGTGEPIARAHVTLHFFQNAQATPQMTILSEADGSFHVSNMPVGGFQILCEKSGYLMASQSAPAGNLGDGRIPAMVFKLTAQAAIQGTVIDERDLPAENVYVQLIRQQVVNGRKQWQGAQGGGTDETGSFRIYGLTSGSYVLMVSVPPLAGRRTKQTAYPTVYYPNATDIAAAQPVDLKAGDEAEIKIRLPEPVPAFEVSGVVLNAGPNAGVTMVRQSAEGQNLPPIGNLNFDLKTKIFRFAHVTPGMYQLTATTHDDEKTTRIASTTISVGDADVTGIRLDPSGATLDGTVRLEADTATQRVSGFVSLHSDRNRLGSQVDADGKFHIPLQPGSYRVFPQINQPQICVRSILAGGRDVRDGFTLAAGAAPEPIDIVMTTHCGSIDVSLAQSDTPPPTNLIAYLLRRSGDELVLERQGYPMPRSGEGASHFAINAVPAGDYLVFVWPADLAIEYANPEYMKQFDSYGQKVSVTDDGRATVSLDKAILRLSNP